MGMKEAVKSIKDAESIAVAGHINPDGDSIGSLLALGLGLKKKGKRVYFVSHDGVPKKYRQLPGADAIIRKTPKTVDLVITVDCSTKGMLGKANNIVSRGRETLEIDHHEIREPFGTKQWIDVNAPAVGEMVYALLKKLKIEITRDIAQNILTSLIVETNSFRLPNVRPFTFKVCAEMVKTGIDFYRLVDMVFWSHSREVAVLSGICMARCCFLNGGRLAWSIVRREDFKKVKGKDEDVDALPDEIRAIEGVDIVIFFREKSQGRLRVSLRSKGNINIARLAGIYGGGGHADVAGCIIPNTRKAVKEMISRAQKLL
ncbi:MAG: bifunctional oligoribonuclease/PAP phosphatase NrnA [Candidatus Omnitrophota bacterium]